MTLIAWGVVTKAPACTESSAIRSTWAMGDGVGAGVGVGVGAGGGFFANTLVLLDL